MTRNEFLKSAQQLANHIDKQLTVAKADFLSEQEMRGIIVPSGMKATVENIDLALSYHGLIYDMAGPYNAWGFYFSFYREGANKMAAFERGMRVINEANPNLIVVLGRNKTRDNGLLAIVAFSDLYQDSNWAELDNLMSESFRRLPLYKTKIKISFDR